MTARQVWDAASAAASGVSVGRLRGPEFSRVTRGAYVEQAWADDSRARCAAVLSRLPDAVLSHWSAAQLHGLPLPMGHEATVHVSVGPGVRAARRAGVCSHSYARAPRWQQVHGLRVTPPVKTWAAVSEIGAVLPDLVALGDALLRQWPDAAGALEAQVASGGSRRGVRLARVALGLLDGRSESPMESRVRVLVHVHGLPAPVPQYVVLDRLGVFLARVDLAWPQYRVVVEYDGLHHLGHTQWARDLRRREALEAAGWVVVVLTADDVLRRPQLAVARIRAAFARL